MISHLRINNFRSIQGLNIELGKFTLLTGSNNSGKSSFIYALLALKNIIINPNASLDSFFNFPFINLGGFSQAVFKKDESKNIEFEIIYPNPIRDDESFSFMVSLGKQDSFFKVDSAQFDDFRLNVTFPYAGSNQKILHINYTDGGRVEVNWSGTSATVGIAVPSELSNKYASRIQSEILSYIGVINSVDGVSIRRGFTKPYFGVVPLSQQLWTEDEIATALSSDRDLEGKVAHYLEEIVNRTFNVRFTPGTSNYYLQTRDRDTAFVSDLVNEGLGTNQLVTLLAKSLQKGAKFICIDEPEIHLHPTIINRLVDTLINIAENEEKQFLISTHSEHFINALLRNVVDGRIESNEVKSYYLTKNAKGITEIENQVVNEKGQISGGLKNFYEAELENLKDFFNLPE